MSKPKAAILGFHEGTAGQIAEWIEKTAGVRLAAFAEDGPGPLSIDAAVENKKRVSQRMEYPTPSSFKGKPFFRTKDWPAKLKALGIDTVVLAVSDNAERLVHLERARRERFKIVSAIHPSALILDQAELEPGVWVNAGCVIGYKAELKAGAFLNTRVQVDHHCILETCCQLDPGVVAAGHVTVRRLAQVHTGAVLINRVIVGERAIVGAGAVCLTDVPPGATVVGVPAKVIRRR
ncbi:MAG: hypothetical protein AAB320_01495 [Elusimicrobiota bacterium]